MIHLDLHGPAPTPTSALHEEPAPDTINRTTAAGAPHESRGTSTYVRLHPSNLAASPSPRQRRTVRICPSSRLGKTKTKTRTQRRRESAIHPYGNRHQPNPSQPSLRAPTPSRKSLLLLPLVPSPLGSEMESVPITAEAIAFTEKKMDMTLEDIIKMSKKKNPGGKKAPRQPIKKRPFQNGISNQGNAKVQRFMESRSSIRQGVIAQRRSNLGGNQFLITKQAAKKAATMPVRSRPVRWNKPSASSTSVQRRPVGEAFQNGKGKEVQNQTPRTMDALFAQMKQQRMRTMPPQQANAAPGRQFAQQRRVEQQRRGRGYGGRNGGNQ